MPYGSNTRLENCGRYLAQVVRKENGSMSVEIDGDEFFIDESVYDEVSFLQKDDWFRAYMDIQDDLILDVDDVVLFFEEDLPDSDTFYVISKVIKI